MPVGFVGLGIPVRCMAILPDSPPEPMVFKARLSGYQEVFPVATAAGGEVTATLTGNTLVVGGSFSGLSGPVAFGIAGGAHLHVSPNGSNATAGGATEVRLRRGMVVSTSEQPASTFRVHARPTLTQGQPVALFVESRLSQNAALRLFQHNGQLVSERTLSLTEGTQVFRVPVDALPQGVYYLSLQTALGTLPAVRIVRQ